MNPIPARIAALAVLLLMAVPVERTGLSGEADPHHRSGRARRHHRRRRARRRRLHRPQVRPASGDREPHRRRRQYRHGDGREVGAGRLHAWADATTQIAINPFVFKKMSYDPLTDLVPVAPIGEAPQFLVTTAKVPATTLKEFIAYARKEDGKLNYVSLGPGSTVHLGGAQFTRLAKVDMQPVQYRGAAPGISDLVAGNVHLISVGIAPVKSLVEAGMLRVLAAGTPQAGVLSAGHPDRRRGRLARLRGHHLVRSCLPRRGRRGRSWSG